MLLFATTNTLHSLALISNTLLQDVKNELRNRSSKLCKRAFEIVAKDPNRLIVAGSAALWLQQGQPTTWFPNDVDIFLYGDLNNPLSNLPWLTVYIKQQDEPYRLPFELHNHNLWYGKIQIILTPNYATVNHLLSSFDLDACKVACTSPSAFTVRRDLTSLLAHIYCAEDRFNGKPLTVEDHLRFPKPYRHLHLAARVRKYKKRGFEHTIVYTNNTEVVAFEYA